MIYIIAAATAAMLAVMFWLVAFRLRRDRVVMKREVTRGKFAFRPKERVRFLLNRSFNVSSDKPDWEDRIVSRLTEIPGDAREGGRSQQRR